MRAVTAADLDPSPETLRAASAHVVSVLSDGEGLDGSHHGMALTVYGMADGVWAHWIDPGDGHHVVAKTGAPDLFVLAADAIAGRQSRR